MKQILDANLFKAKSFDYFKYKLSVTMRSCTYETEIIFLSWFLEKQLVNSTFLKQTSVDVRKRHQFKYIERQLPLLVVVKSHFSKQLALEQP